MSTHTPGPWSVCDGPLNYQHRILSPGDAFDSTVCDVTASVDASLIAAAPDLLYAGKRVTDAFRAHGRSSGLVDDARSRRECESAMLALDAAIAKATGAA